MGLFGDLLSSGLLAASTAIVNIAGVFVLARVLEPATFGLFALSRRMGAFSASISNLNGHLAVSRYLGFYDSEPQRRAAVFTAGSGLFLLVPVLTAVFFGVIHVVAHQVSWVQSLEGGVWWATMCLAAALSSGLVVFSILRGLGHPQSANLQQLCFVSIILLLGFVANELTVAALIAAAAGASTAVNLGFYAWVCVLHRREWVRPTRQSLQYALAEMLRYSLPRFADGPCQAALPLIGMLLAPAIGGLALAAHMHIAQTLVRMTEVLIVPLSVVFLPIAARQVRQGQIASLNRQAQQIFDAIVLVGMQLTVQMVAWSSPLLHAAFGERYAGAAPYLWWTLPSTLPYLLYAGFRSYIDGYSVRPVNFLHLLAAGAVVLAASLGFGSLGHGVGLAISYTAGVMLLGGLTVRYIVAHFGVRVWTAASAQVLGVAIGVGILSAGIARVAPSSAVVCFVLFALCQALCAIAAWLVHQRLRHPTVLYAVAKVRGTREGSPPAADAARYAASV